MKISSAVYLKRPRLTLPVCFPCLTVRYENESVNQSPPPLITCQLRCLMGPVIHKGFYENLPGGIFSIQIYAVLNVPGHLWESINKERREWRRQMKLDNKKIYKTIYCKYMV